MSNGSISEMIPSGKPGKQGALRQVLGPFSATCIVVGAIIGIGIFFTPQNVALVTGSEQIAMWTWAIGGLIAMSGALTFAELGGMYARTGGQYEILRDAWSAPVGFAYVFCNATIIQAGAIAIIAYFAALNLGVVIYGSERAELFNFTIASIMIVGLTIANSLGVRHGSSIQNATVVAKVLTLLIIGLLAFTTPLQEAVSLNETALEKLTPTVGVHPLGLIFAGLVPAFFAFGGWQHALWVGGEVRDPKINVPRSIIIGVAVVTGVYLLVNWAFFRLVGFEGVCNSKTFAANAVGVVWPAYGSRIVAGAITISALGVLNAQLLSGPRLICGMAQSGKFFKPFAKVSPQTRTPLAAILFLGGLGLAILLIAADADRIDNLLTSVVLVDSAFFFMTGVALFLIRRRNINSGSFRTPFYPLFPALFVVGEVLILTGAFLNPKYNQGAWIGILWILAALICYAIFFRGNSDKE